MATFASPWTRQRPGPGLGRGPAQARARRRDLLRVSNADSRLGKITSRHRASRRRRWVSAGVVINRRREKCSYCRRFRPARPASPAVERNGGGARRALLPGQLGNRGTGASRGACGSGSACVGVMSIMSWGPRWYLRLIGQPLGLAAALGPQGNRVEAFLPRPGSAAQVDREHHPACPGHARAAPCSLRREAPMIWLVAPAEP